MRLNWGTAPIGAFQVLEICLVLLCVVIAFVRPALARRSFEQVEATILRISRRPWLCAAILFLFPVLLRALLLPVYAPPVPFISDEYAYLLQGDTFASGRLTNPSPPLPEQFASVYVLSQPSYTAEYQVGQGATLAIGQALTGSPWFGVVLSMGVLCSLLYWALLAWLPREWAFVSALVIVGVQIGVLSYWMNSYWGGSVPAIGGTLVLGAFPRLVRGNAVLYAALTSAGLLILLNSRPLEGILLGAIVVAALAYWAFVSKEIKPLMLIREVMPVLLLSALVAVSFAGFYNRRVTGKADQFPYMLYRERYGMPQGFFWQNSVTTDNAMPADIRSEYEDQMRQHERRKSWKALLGATGGKVRRFWEFYIGIPLTLVLLFLPFVWRERNMGLAFWTLLLVVGLDNMTFFAYFPHYSAAATMLIVLVLIQCIRCMRHTGERGLFLSRSLPLVCLAGLLIPCAGRLIEGVLPARVAPIRRLWASEFEHDVSRENFVPALEHESGPQLVLVRYKPYDGQKKTEWVFNRADLQSAKIVWAREPGDSGTTSRLLRQFAGRKVWLAEPDALPPRIAPYFPPHP